MNRKEENEKKEEKWRPVHEIIIEILEKPSDSNVVSRIDTLWITRLYGNEKAKVPLKDIPRFKKALKPWIEREPSKKENIILVLDNLEQQEKEEKAKEKEKKKDFNLSEIKTKRIADGHS